MATGNVNAIDDELLHLSPGEKNGMNVITNVTVQPGAVFLSFRISGVSIEKRHSNGGGGGEFLPFPPSLPSDRNKVRCGGGIP